jgi:hypothetical protein
MSAQHVSWGSIELLHNAIRTLTLLNEQGQPFPVIEYRAKVKLHGTNCAVQITGTGNVAQSRNLILTSAADHKGFATWVAARADFWSSVAQGLVVFGEWCGPGVEKGMAISQAPSKLFAVFAIREGEAMIYEPEAIEALLPNRPADVHVLPWEGDPITIDFGSREAIERVAQQLNDRVDAVEREDPWCKRVLGVSGLGEGLVFYPNRAPFDSTLMFKAKGDKHRTAGKKAVQVDATAAASIDEFVALVVTDARLRQGLEAVGGQFDAKKTGAFLGWISADVKKESVAELEASGLTWAQVEKGVQQRARKWFIGGGL